MPDATDGPTRLYLLAAPATSPSVLYGLFDVLGSVGVIYREVTEGTPGQPVFDVRIAAASAEPFHCYGRVPVEPDATFEEIDAAEVVIVCDRSQPIDRPPRDLYARESAWLRRMHDGGALIASVCSGSLVLAEAGLLDGLEAAGHWCYAEMFRTHYPQVRLREDLVLCRAGEDERILTAGAVTAWQDLALHLVHRFAGHEEAIRTAKVFLFSEHADGQLPYAVTTPRLQTRDAAIRDCQIWIAENYAARNPVGRMAARAGLTRRGFARRFRAATYLYQDGPRAWYATQPTVTKLAEDRAEQLKRDPDRVAGELDARLRADLKRGGDFSRIHPLPRSGADVPDDFDARLVVLPAEHPYSKENGSAAEVAAKAILASRGNTPRLYQNTLVFLAADKVRLQDLDEALRKYLAWSSIVADKETLNLDPHQARQAETQKQAADGAVTARLPETYQWLLVPEQTNPQAPVAWQAVRLTGGDALAVRASKKLRSDELLIASLGSTILRKHMDEVPLWRGDHVAVKQLIDDFARYLYLPRVAGPEVLAQAIADGIALLTWRADTFGYAESFDEAAGRYRGLRGGHGVGISPDSGGILVKPDVAGRQLDSEAPPAPRPNLEPGETGTRPTPGNDATTPNPPATQQLRRFHGSVRVDSARVGRDAGRIADEVIAHLAGQVGADVTVTIEIEARLPNGATDQLVRTVTENSRTLKFDSHGFEKE